MKKAIIAVALALLGGVSNAEIIAEVERGERRIMFFEDRIGCPKGLKTFGVWNSNLEKITVTGCWYYEPLNIGSEITTQMHGTDVILHLPVSALSIVPDFHNRARAH